MSTVAVTEREVFDRSFGAIIEGACPLDGGLLERRKGWGFAFCVECGQGWTAGTGNSRYINHYPSQTHWSESGLAWMDRDGVTFDVPPPVPAVALTGRTVTSG